MKLNLLNIIIILFLIFSISCDNKVSRSPVEPPPQEGKIIVTSIPPGFTIYLNEKNTGRKTPDSLIFLDEGSYDITLKRKYFIDTTITLSLSEDEVFNIDIDYINNPSTYGDLILSSFPEGANVFVNDSLTNIVTPDTIHSLFPGEYKINYKKFSHRAVEFIAVVRSSESLSYSEDLRDTSVWVDYQVFNSSIQTNSLSAIAIDNNGIKWIGSLDAGLIKFDEANFISFNTSNSQIPSNRINCINIDQLNNVWVGTDFGIGIFNGNSWAIYNRNNSGLTIEKINSIKFDATGNAWIGTSGNLVKFDGINWTVYYESLERDWINDLVLVSDNEMWLAISNAGVFKFVNGNFIEYPKEVYNYPTLAVSSAAKDYANNIWFCFYQDSTGRSGISYWDGAIFNNYFLGTPNNFINYIFIDINNNKWICTSEGLTHFDASNSSETFRTQNSLISSDYIKASVVDQNGNVWITTFGGGLNKYKPPL